MEYFGNIGFGMFGWGDKDIGIFGGMRSGNFQIPGQFRCRFAIYDNEHKLRTGTDKMIGSLEFNVTVPEDDSQPHEIMELISLEIAKPLRGQGYGRRTVDAIMRAASDDIKICDIKKSKVGFWEAVGLEDISTKAGTISGFIRKQPSASLEQAASATLAV